jgi:predicted DNA-binding WGR domain protein
MKKHLKYIDGTSDKFWQIEVADTTYTVVYGRNGTSGTAQTKSFSSNEECLKAAEKLLNEKIKKGYSEDGEVLAGNPASKSAKSSGSNIQEVLNAYDAVILSKDLKTLLPFLKDNAKGNLDALKKHIRKAKRYWMDFVDLTNERQYRRDNSQWGTRGEQRQFDIITLSAIALFNKTDINSWDEAVEMLKRVEEPLILEVLHWAKPEWITGFLLDKAKKDSWRRFDYMALRFMEGQSLISYEPELYALSLGSFSEWAAKIKAREFINFVLSDQLAYERDVPELFNYESDLQGGYFREKDTEAYDAHRTWEIIYNALLTEGKLTRNYYIEQIILIQTKEWSNTLKTFFRKRLTELNPATEELLPYQENIFAALQYAHAPVVNFAMELIKKMYEDKKFNVNSFLDWLEPVMMASDNKTAIKSAFPILEKLNKQYPKLNQRITALLADVYVVPDLNLQERATKLLLKIASGKDADLSEKLSSYVALMQGNVRTSLSAFLTEETMQADPDETEVYHYEPKKEQLLLQEIELPKDWNDIVFLFGKFIASDEVADGEILLNTFITQKHLFPKDYSEQLQPYGKQLQKKYFESVYKNYVSTFLQLKIADYNAVYKNDDRPYQYVKTLMLIKPLLHVVQSRMTAENPLPMLSFPSHLPHWVAPKVLLERLIAYQKEGAEINKLDLSVAISRMPRENVEEAIPLLEQLNPELKDLMAFCLGKTKEIKFKGGSVLTKLLSKINVTADDQLKAIWAVAARTYYPDDTFPEFEETYLKDIPFVVSPFAPAITFEERWNEFVNYQTKKNERSPSWYELTFHIPGYKNMPDYFLYGLDLFGRKSRWEYMMDAEANVYYWDSLMPQNSAALAYFLLRSSCSLSSNGGRELKGFLTLVNRPGFVFSDLTMLVFACTFFQEKKDIRLMSAEVLINLIEMRAVDLGLLSEKLAYLSNNKYGPFLRLVESISTLKDISPLHNSAFLLLTEGIFKGMDVEDKLPVNFKKIVEHYVDVLYKTKAQPSAEAVALFEKLKDNASLKALVKQILK